VGAGELLTAELPRLWIEQARVVFLTVIGAGLRRGELLGLHGRDVALADSEGTALRVRETFVRNAVETPKSEAGERTIALADDGRQSSITNAAAAGVSPAALMARAGS
jgi:hypothetical protein